METSVDSIDSKIKLKGDAKAINETIEKLKTFSRRPGAAKLNTFKMKGAPGEK